MRIIGLCCLLFLTNLFASDFEASKRYGLLVNKMVLPASKVQNRSMHKIDYKAFSSFKLSSANKADARVQRLFYLVREEQLTDKPFAVFFRTDAQRRVIEITLIKRSQGELFERSIEPSTVAQRPQSTQPMPQKKGSQPTTPPTTKSTVAEKPSTKEGKTVLVVVNRKATELEKQAVKEAIETTFAKIKEHQYSNPTSELIRKRLIEKIEYLEITNEGFSIQWQANAEGHPIGPITLKSKGSVYYFRNLGEGAAVVATKPVTPPKVDVTQSTIISLDELLKQIESKKLQGKALQKEVVLWLLTDPTAVRGCEIESAIIAPSSERATAVLAASKLQQVSAIRDSVGLLKELATRFTSETRLNIYANSVAKTACFQELFTAASQLMQQQKPALANDFHYWLDQLYQNRAKIRYDGEEHRHVIEDAKLMAVRHYVSAIFLKFLNATQFRAYLDQQKRHWLTLNTNSPNADSRKEPIDILSYHIGWSVVKQISSQTVWDDVSRNRLATATIQHILKPETYKPRFFLAASSSEHTQSLNGDPTYFLFCSSPQLKLSNTALNVGVNRNSHFSWMAVRKSLVRSLIQNKAQQSFTCGDRGAVFSAKAEVLNVKLNNPNNPSFVVGTDNKIKAVVTFPMVTNASKTFVNNLLVGTTLKGFRTTKQTRQGNLKTEVLKELLDADFYFPVGRSTSDSTFSLGYADSQRIRLTRTVGDVTIEMILFSPPTSGKGQVESKMNYDEVSALFKKRRALSVKRRLTIMNVACGAKTCIPRWLAAYKKSLEGQSYSAEQIRRLNAEVPVIIGPSRSFKTNSLSEIMKYTNYPFTAVNYAAQQESLKQFLSYLSSEKFGPDSSTYKTTEFNVTEQKKLISVTVSTTDGVAEYLKQ